MTSELPLKEGKEPGAKSQKGKRLECCSGRRNSPQGHHDGWTIQGAENWPHCGANKSMWQASQNLVHTWKENQDSIPEGSKVNFMN